MKKIIYIIVTLIGLMSFSSCRSTSSPCGLAENHIKINQLPSSTITINSILIV